MYADFRGGLFEGFIIDVALHGKYRRQNNAYARRFHYPIRKWSLVPLQGPIARDHKGVLEVYYGDCTWSSRMAVSQFMRRERHSSGEPGYRVRTFRVPLGNGGTGESLRRKHPIGPFKQADFYENDVATEVRIGRQVVGIRIQGGANTRVRTDEQLLRLLVKRSKRYCSA